jgi:hypothetical protein
MKTVNSTQIDELRTGYQRSDFNTLVRGKYALRLSQETNVMFSQALKSSHAGAWELEKKGGLGIVYETKIKKE